METAHEIFNMKQTARDNAFAVVAKIEQEIKRARLACDMSIEYAENQEQADAAIDSMIQKITRYCEKGWKAIAREKVAVKGR